MQGKRKKKHRLNLVEMEEVKWRTIRVLLPNLKSCDMHLNMLLYQAKEIHVDRTDTSIFKNSKREINDQDKYNRGHVQE